MLRSIENRIRSLVQNPQYGVNDELADLNMKGVSLGVNVAWREELSATGQSDVEFMIQSSKKDEPRKKPRQSPMAFLTKIKPKWALATSALKLRTEKKKSTSTAITIRLRESPTPSTVQVSV